MIGCSDVCTFFFFFQAEDGIRDVAVTGVQTCALPIFHEYHGKTIPRLDSPKATIMALIADGILTHKLPWVLVLLGVFLTIAIELMGVDRKSTRLNSSHGYISYAVFCLKKKTH